MKLLYFFSKRFFSIVFSLAIAVTLIFILMEYIPGNFLEMQQARLGESSAAHEQFKTYEANFRKEFLLDEPLPYRIGHYLKNAIQFKFGTSYANRDVLLEDLILEKLPVTLVVTSLGLLFAIILGLPIGIIAALRKNSWIDYLLMTTSTVGMSIPPYVVGVALIYCFANFVKNFEVSGAYPLSFMNLPAGGWGEFRHLILPAFAVALAPTAAIARFIRSSIRETLQQDFVRTAYSKGLSKIRVILVHALRPSLIPVLTVMGPQLGYMIIGSVFIEEIFRLPGIGRLFVQAAQERDAPLLITTAFVLAATVMIINQLIDILYSVIDPRIELE